MTECMSFCMEYYITGQHENGFDNCQTCSQNGSSYSGSDLSNSFGEQQEKILYYDGMNFYEPEEEDLEAMEELQLMEELKDCECCKGNFNNCNGEVCASMGNCFCYIQYCHEKSLSEEFNSSSGSSL